MAKIAFFETDTWEEEYLKNALSDHDLSFTKERLTLENIHKAVDAQIISSFIYSIFTKEIIDQLPNLKLIATQSSGFDHIDIEKCKQREIVVSNVPTYGEHTVAEHTFALILALSRKLIPSVEKTRRGDFSLDGLRGFDLQGKTIGVIGQGHIGKKVIEFALCFGMKVLVCTRTPGKAKEHVKYVTLEELLGKSDIVTIHVAHTKDTHHMINMQNISQFKKGSLLINTARGAVVETQAILMGLEKGILRGAGLDVLEEECSLREEKELLSTTFLQTCDIKTQLLNHVLLDRTDVIVTPHNAFNSNEALKQILETTVLNIKAFLAKKPQNVVS